MRTRLALFAVGCIFVATVVAGTFHLIAAGRDRTHAEADLQRHARTGVALVEEQIAAARALLRGLSTSQSLQSDDLVTFDDQARLIETPFNSWIMLVRPDYADGADVLVNTRLPYGMPSAGPATDSASRFIGRVASARQTMISDVMFSPELAKHVVLLGRPILKGDDVLYVLTLVVPEIGATLSSQVGHAEEIFGVVDGVGGLLPQNTRPDQSMIQPPFDPASLARTDPEGILEGTAPDGTPLYVAVARSALTGWSIFYARPKAALDAPVNQALLLVGIGGLLLPVAGGIAALLAGPAIIGPLRRRIAEDDERVRVIANTVPSVVFTANARGECDYISDRFYEYTGLSPAGALGKGWMAAVFGADRPKLLRACEGRPASSDPSDVELRLRGKDGAFRWFAIRMNRTSGGTESRFLGTATDIEDLKQTESTMRQLSAQLMRSQDDERRRIARDIHDTTVQNIVAAKIEIDQVHDGAILPGEPTTTALGEARGLLDRSLSELRTLSYLLHPPMLDELGLASALRWYAQGLEKRSGIAVSVDAPRVPRLPADIETTIFRIVQEGLSNVHRHSGSRVAQVALSATTEQVNLEIADEGNGMSAHLADRGPASLGVGIPGMRLRVQQLNGSLEIESGSKGTKIRVSIPIPERKRATEQTPHPPVRVVRQKPDQPAPRLKRRTPTSAEAGPQITVSTIH